MLAACPRQVEQDVRDLEKNRSLVEASMWTIIHGTGSGVLPSYARILCFGICGPSNADGRIYGRSESMGMEGYLVKEDTRWSLSQAKDYYDDPSPLEFVGLLPDKTEPSPFAFIRHFLVKTSKLQIRCLWGFMKLVLRE